jgi:hypothetical protein
MIVRLKGCQVLIMISSFIKCIHIVYSCTYALLSWVIDEHVLFIILKNN